MFLQLASIVIIAWAAMSRGEPISSPTRQLLVLAVIALAIVALQNVPLPVDLWRHLPLRDQIARDFSTLGMAPSPQPLSLNPSAGLGALLTFLPPLAIFIAMTCLSAYRPHLMAIALVAGTVAGIGLGTLQVATSSGFELSGWYLYPNTNAGKAVGFFANANHMGSLLVATIPFLAALVSVAKGSGIQRYSAIVTAAAGLFLVVLVGLALNGSTAGYALAVPVTAMSAAMVLPRSSAMRWWLIGLSFALVVGLLAALQTIPIGSTTFGERAASAAVSREEILATTWNAVRAFMPLGTGLGTFPFVYPLFENPADVSRIYVVHAHNDYLEVALELGLPGLILMLAFLAWWGAAAWRAWRTAEGGAYAKAAAVASAAILVHSTVDFPLRTAGIAACFAMCLALLAQSRAAPPQEKSQLRRRRHVEFK